MFVCGHSFADLLSIVFHCPSAVCLCDLLLTVHRSSSSCSRSAARCWLP
jgi:hypothetical protein